MYMHIIVTLVRFMDSDGAAGMCSALHKFLASTIGTFWYHECDEIVQRSAYTGCKSACLFL